MMPVAAALVIVVAILLLLPKPLLSKPPPLESLQLNLSLFSLTPPPFLLLLSAPPPLSAPLDLLFALGLLLLALLVLIFLVLFRAPLAMGKLPHEVSVPLSAEAVVDEVSDAVRAIVPVPSPLMAPRRMPAVAQVAVYAVAVLVAARPVGNGPDEVPRQFVLGEDRGGRPAMN